MGWGARAWRWTKERLWPSIRNSAVWRIAAQRIKHRFVGRYHRIVAGMSNALPDPLWHIKYPIVELTRARHEGGPVARYLQWNDGLKKYVFNRELLAQVSRPGTRSAMGLRGRLSGRRPMLGMRDEDWYNHFWTNCFGSQISPFLVSYRGYLVPHGEWQAMDEGEWEQVGDESRFTKLMTDLPMQIGLKELFRQRLVKRWQDFSISRVSKDVLEHVDPKYHHVLREFYEQTGRKSPTTGLAYKEEELKDKFKVDGLGFGECNADFSARLYQKLIESSLLDKGNAYIEHVDEFDIDHPEYDPEDRESHLKERFKLIRVMDPTNSKGSTAYRVSGKLADEFEHGSDEDRGAIISGIKAALDPKNEGDELKLEDGSGRKINLARFRNDPDCPVSKFEVSEGDIESEKYIVGKTDAFQIVNTEGRFYVDVHGTLHFTKHILSTEDENERGWQVYKETTLPNLTPDYLQLLNRIGEHDVIRKKVYALMRANPNLTLGAIMSDKGFQEDVKKAIGEVVGHLNKLEVPDDVYHTFTDTFGLWHGRWWTDMRERVGWENVDSLRDELTDFTHSLKVFDAYDFGPEIQSPGSFIERKRNIGLLLSAAAKEIPGEDPGARKERLGVFAKELLAKHKEDDVYVNRVVSQAIGLVDGTRYIKQLINIPAHSSTTREEKAEKEAARRPGRR